MSSWNIDLPVCVFYHVSTLRYKQPHWHMRTFLDRGAFSEQIPRCTRSYKGTVSKELFYGTMCTSRFHPIIKYFRFQISIKNRPETVLEIFTNLYTIHPLSTVLLIQLNPFHFSFSVLNIVTPLTLIYISRWVP